MPLPDGATQSKLFKDAEAELMALKLPISKIRLTGERAFELSEYAERKFAFWLAKAPELLHPAHAAEITQVSQRLTTRATVFQAATTALMQVEGLPDFDTLRKRVRFLDEDLFGYISHSLRGEVALAPVFKAISRGQGYWDDAQDVVAECQIIRKYFARLTGFPYTLDEVNGFEREAVAFMAAVKNRAQVGEHEHDIRSRAWTLFAFEYDRVKRAGRYLLDGAPGALVEFPGLTPV